MLVCILEKEIDQRPKFLRRLSLRPSSLPLTQTAQLYLQRAQISVTAGTEQYAAQPRKRANIHRGHMVLYHTTRPSLPISAR